MASLGVICARAGSKRLPGKNLKPLRGVPLLGYVCRAARASRIDRVILSTEDAAIARAAAAVGVEAPFERPRALAADYASSPDIVGHAIDWMAANGGGAYDIAVLIQPTTPFLTPADIDACLDAVASGTASAFTVRQATEPPEWMFVHGPDGAARTLLGDPIAGAREHSQHVRTCYVPTGGAYAVRVAAMRSQGRIICDPAHLVETTPERAADIDDELDFLYAEMLAEHFDFGLIPAQECEP